MATFEDDFESYTIGAHPPIGGWTSPFNNPNASTIVAGGSAAAGAASTKAISILGGSIVKDFNPSFYSAATIFCHFFPTQATFVSGENVNVVNLLNGPNGISRYTEFIRLQLEVDTTLSCYCGTQFICNSGDFAVRLQSWNFLQINVEFTTVTIAGVDFLRILSLHVAIDGIEIMSKTNVDTGVQIASLLGADHTYNILEFLSNRMIIDNVSWNSTLQTLLTYPHSGSPFDKVYQGNVEIPILPDSADISVFQGIAEFPILPDNTNMRAFQGVVELILLDSVIQGLWKVREI
jgi:hypothetical protein